MYQTIYNIEGTINLDTHECFSDINTYSLFQTNLEKFKSHIKQLVDDKESKTFYKFGDGDYHFLIKSEVGSAKPGSRAISKGYNQINHNEFLQGSQECDYYTCEIYPKNRKMFKEVIHREINYPAEYGYGLVGNKWFFNQFKGKIGLIGASEKLYLIEELLKYDEYKEYLGIDRFNDYIHYPQKYACDDVNLVEEFVGNQLKTSTSNIFLLGIGHSKSAILHRLKKYTNAIFMDVGGGIDMIAGSINNTRPFAGGWVNYRIKNYNYKNIDYLGYNYQNEKYL